MKCECGCGQETTVYQGKSRRFINGHNGRGRILSKEYKRKISDTHKKNKKWLGRKHSTNTKQKIRRSCEGNNSGENHPNWQGGISFEPYCPKFNNHIREDIREKYGRVCFLCGKTEQDNGSKLSVHHTDHNKEQGCNGYEWKLVPLCKSCHGKIHKPDKEDEHGI